MGSGCRARRSVSRPLRVDPDVPLMCLIEVTLRPPGPTASAKSLIDVELERLRPVTMINVEPQVISEMSGTIAAADRSPVQLIGIGLFAGQAELRGRAVQGGSGLMQIQTGGGYS